MYYDDFNRLVADLYDCTPEQLNEVTRNLNNIRDLQAIKVRGELRLRDSVKFRPTRGRYAGVLFTGTITKLNRKTASVKVTDGTNWRVSVTMLEKN